jgi:hypothetical protein
MTSRISICGLAILALASLCATNLPGADLPEDSVRHDIDYWPKIELVGLTNPSVFAVAASTDQDVNVAGSVIDEGNDVRRFGFGYRLDALIPFDYHPGGKITTAADLRLNWLWDGEASSNYEKYLGKMVNGAAITREDLPPTEIRRSYSGALKLVIGQLEAARDSSAWVLRNTAVGLEVEQQIPGTIWLGAQINRSRIPAGVTPLVIAVGGQQVYDAMQLDSSTTRASLDARWQMPVFNSLYLIPQLNVKWQKKMPVRSYFQGDIRLVVGGPAAIFLRNRLPFLISPFARYFTGRQAPDYRVVNGWQFGISVLGLGNNQR